MALNSGVDEVPEIIPFNEYNFKKAKLKVCLAWLAHKAHQSLDADVPADLLDPFFKDGKGQDNLKPSVIYQLASSELYCLACSNIFPPSIHPWSGHGSVIQALSRKGIYVLDEVGEPVSEVNLGQTQRIKLSSHQAMMEAIMKAYTAESVSIDAVVKAVRKIISFNASSELPFDQEDALLFWINKVCLAVRHDLERDRKNQQEKLVQSAPPSVRMRRDQLQIKELPYIPVIEDLMKDLSNGCSVAILISYYCPQLLKFDDIVLRETMSFADSLHNLQLIRSFFLRHRRETFHYQLEDLLYTHHSLKTSIVAFCAELFSIFEVTRPESLMNGEVTELTPMTGVSAEISQIKSSLPISEATKRSYMDSSLIGDETRASASPSSQPKLLPGRQKQHRRSMVIEGSPLTHHDLRRSTSLEELSPDKQPIPAWQSPDIIRSSAEPSVHKKNAESLLANVSIESDVGHSHDTYLITGRTQANGGGDDKEVATLTASAPPGVGANPASSWGFNPVDLPPAGLTTQSADMKNKMRLDLALAEKKSSTSVSSSPRSPRGVGRERILPSPGRGSKEPRSVPKAVERGESSGDGMISWEEQRVSGDTRGTPESAGSTETGETVVAADEIQSARKQWANRAFQQAQQRAQDGSPQVMEGKSGAAFFVSHEPEKPIETGKSFVMSDKHYDDAESAHLAGIPVVASSMNNHQGSTSFRLSDEPCHQNGPYLSSNEHQQSFVLSDKLQEEGQLNPGNGHPAHAPSFVLSADDQSNEHISHMLAGSGGYPPARQRFILSDQPPPRVPAMTTSLQELEGDRRGLDHLKTNTLPSNLSSSLHALPSMSAPPHIRVANSDSPPHVANNSSLSSSRQQFYLSDNNIPQLPIMEATNEGRLNGSMSINPMSDSGDACLASDSSKLHEELKESESKDTSPFMLSSDHCDNLHESSGDMSPSELAAPVNVEIVESGNTVGDADMHAQPNDHMITWLANANPSSDPINPDREVHEGLPLSELAQIRMQLEKKRRHIDHEKRKLDRHWHKQKMKVNKEAFLQCVAQKRPPEDTHDPPSATADHSTRVRDIHPATPGKITFADISAQRQERKLKDDHRAFSDSSGRSVTDSGSNRSASPTSSAGSRSPQLTNEEYSASIEKLNANLTELQSQITRLSQQQEQQQTQVSPRVPQEMPQEIPRQWGSPQDRVNNQPQPNGQWSPARPVGPIVQKREDSINSRPNIDIEPEVKVDPILLDIAGQAEPYPPAQTFSVKQQAEAAAGKQNYLEIDFEPGKTRATKPKPKLSAKGKPAAMATAQAAARVVPTTGVKTPQVQEDSPPRVDHVPVERLVEKADNSVDEPEDLNETVSSTASEDKPVGFVVQMAEQKKDEMAKRREVFLKTQLKRQEQERKKKSQRDEEMEKQRDERRKKQDEQDQKKADEKARREQIMAEYQNRKKREQDGEVERPAKPKAKARPKSRVMADSTNVKQPVMKKAEAGKGDAVDSGTSSAPSSSAFSKFKADKTFKALPDRAGPKGSKIATLSPDSPSKTPTTTINGAPIKRSGSFKGTRPPSPGRSTKGTRPPSPGRSSPGRRSPSPRPPSPMMQRRRSNTLPESLKSDDIEGGRQGPKLYVKPTSRSNKNLICNAISHCVLAGVPNIPQKDKVLAEVNKSDHKHFMILFRDQGLQYRAVYGFDPETDEMSKVFGTGPRHITNKMLECIYKYDSGSKKFSKIHSKTLSVQVDGLTIGQIYWQSKKASTKK